MLVTVWRHGEAGAAPRDEDRALTERGQQSLALAVMNFQQWRDAQKLAPVSQIRFSPLVRTRQTAELLGKALSVDPETCAALAPGTDLFKPERFLPEGDGHTILVTHQPFVSQVIWHWLDDDRLEPILPGGWATLELLAPSRGGASLIGAKTAIY